MDQGTELFQQESKRATANKAYERVMRKDFFRVWEKEEPLIVFSLAQRMIGLNYEGQYRDEFHTLKRDLVPLLTAKARERKDAEAKIYAILKRQRPYCTLEFLDHLFRSTQKKAKTDLSLNDVAYYFINLVLTNAYDPLQLDQKAVGVEIQKLFTHSFLTMTPEAFTEQVDKLQKVTKLLSSITGLKSSWQKKNMLWDMFNRSLTGSAVEAVCSLNVREFCKNHFEEDFEVSPSFILWDRDYLIDLVVWNKTDGTIRAVVQSKSHRLKESEYEVRLHSPEYWASAPRRRHELGDQSFHSMTLVLPLDKIPVKQGGISGHDLQATAQTGEIINVINKSLEFAQLNSHLIGPSFMIMYSVVDFKEFFAHIPVQQPEAIPHFVRQISTFVQKNR